MKYVYNAIFKKTETGYDVRVPDLQGLFTFGETLPEALEMAQDAMEMWLWDAENKKEKVPTPSEKIELEQDEFVNLVLADTDDYRRKNDTKSVKKTLSIPSWLNYEAEKANVPFSQVLQEGIKKYLDIAE